MIVVFVYAILYLPQFRIRRL